MPISDALPADKAETSIAPTTMRAPPPLTWVACVYPVAIVEEKPAELEEIFTVLDNILHLLHERDDFAESHIALYAAPIYDQTYGGIRHIRRVENTMVVLAGDHYLELCVNFPNIEKLHIVAGESGAYLAIRLINFFVKYGDKFRYQLNEFDRRWADFLVSGENMDGENERSQLIGKVILVCPSLPSPSGMAKTLWRFISPPIYDFNKRQPAQMPGEIILVDIGVPTPHLELVTVVGLSSRTVRWKDYSVKDDMLGGDFPSKFKPKSRG